MYWSEREIRRLTSLSYVVTVAFIPFNLNAAGFEVPHKSIYGVGLANAVVADVTSYGAVPYNPSLMVLHSGVSASAGVLVNAPKSEVKVPSGTVEGQREDLFVVPYLHASSQLGQSFWAGLSVNSPFGQGTKWDAGTFTPASPALQGFMPTETQAKIVSLSPAIAYKLNDNAGISFGLDYYNALTAKLDTEATSLEGDGDGIGWQLGGFYRKGAVTYAARYHSAADIDLEGDLNSPLGSSKIETELNLPYRFQTGVQYHWNEEIDIEFDYVKVGWSAYDTLDVKSKATGALVSSVTNDWRDVNAYRFGGKYKYADNIVLMAGYSHERTPEPDAFFSPRSPGNNRNVYSIGAEYSLNNSITLNAAYIFVDPDDRNPDTKGLQTTTDHNGTDSIAGEYDSHLHAIGLSVTYHVN